MMRFQTAFMPCVWDLIPLVTIFALHYQNFSQSGTEIETLRNSIGSDEELEHEQDSDYTVSVLRNQLSMLEIPLEEMDTDMTREERESFMIKKAKEALRKVQNSTEQHDRDNSVRLQSTVEIERRSQF